MVTQLKPGMRVISANGNYGTVQGYTNPAQTIVALRLDNGRQISCLASLCTVCCVDHDDDFGCCDTCGQWVSKF